MNQEARAEDKIFLGTSDTGREFQKLKREKKILLESMR
jgi:hypothetical protein